MPSFAWLTNFLRKPSLSLETCSEREFILDKCCVLGQQTLTSFFIKNRPIWDVFLGG